MRVMANAWLIEMNTFAEHMLEQGFRTKIFIEASTWPQNVPQRQGK